MSEDYVVSTVQRLQAARDAYYKQAAPVMTDGEYDALERELRQFVEFNPQFTDLAAPVLQGVGSDLAASGGRVRHSVPMLSIENQYTEDDFLAQCAKWGEWPVVLEPKFDGISVSVIYEGGRLVRALTRGTGAEGEDITAAVLEVASVPKTLPAGKFPKALEVRGELVMRNSTLARINAEAAGGRQYVSTRNLVAGTMKQKDVSNVAGRGIELRPWDVLVPTDVPAGKQPVRDSRLERLWALSGAGFAKPEGILLDKPEQVLPALRGLLALNRESDVNCDGVVMKADSVSACQRLGFARMYTNWATCYKPQSASGTTYLREVQWQVGRTGRVSPVAVCDPVVLAGARVTNASLNNITWIRNMGLRLGAKVEMLRSGDVIPQVVRVVDEGDAEIEPPTHCPECGTLLVSGEGDAGIVQLYCQNRGCPAVLAKHLEFIGGRAVLEIDNLGPDAARKLVSGGFARNLAELYEFQADMMRARAAVGDDMVVETARKKGGFDATLPRMLDSLERAKTASWERWIKALGIPMIGETLGRVIAERLDLQPGDMRGLGGKLLSFTAQEVEGFGPEKRGAIEEFVAAGRLEMTEKLHELGVRPAPVEKPKVAEGAPLAGVVFCITGEFSEDRKALTKKLEALGAVGKSGVSSKINLLIVGDAAGKTKPDKARQLGIRQEGREWLEKALGGMKADFAEKA